MKLFPLLTILIFTSCVTSRKTPVVNPTPESVPLLIQHVQSEKKGILVYFSTEQKCLYKGLFPSWPDSLKTGKVITKRPDIKPILFKLINK